jgi:ferredoxin/flavodoxin
VNTQEGSSGITNVSIFYFSGTGNTKAIASLFAESLKKHGCHVERFAIEDILKNDIPLRMEQDDLVGFGYPVHAFNAPRIFFDFLKRIPPGNQKKSFVFKSFCDPFMNGGSTSIVRNALTKKGYDVFHETLFVMPANVLVRYRDELIKQLYMAAANKVDLYVHSILSGEKRLQNNSIFSRISTASFSTMESFGARFFGKHLMVSDTCNLCEICVNRCPTKNIHRNRNQITFGLNCTLCMRCIYGCPQKAIFPGFLKFLVLKNWYNLPKIMNNPLIKDTYISKKTKGYFRHFYPYLTQKEENPHNDKNDSSDLR